MTSKKSKLYLKKVSIGKNQLRDQQKIPPIITEKVQIQDQKKEAKSVPNGENKEGKVNTDLIARNLLRLYQYLHDQKPFQEQALIEELEIGTPNAELRNRNQLLEFELDAVREENQALRESSLHKQLEYSEQLEQMEMENKTLREKIKEIDKAIKKELEDRGKKYQEIIDDLRNRLKETMAKNEKITVVSEALNAMQNRISYLCDQNEELQRDKEKVQTYLDEIEKELSNIKVDLQKCVKKNDELQQKDKLQTMVIEGYKRKYGE